MEWATVGLTVLSMAAGSAVSVFMSGRTLGRYDKSIEEFESHFKELRADLNACVTHSEFQVFKDDVVERRTNVDRRIESTVARSDLVSLEKRFEDFKTTVTSGMTDIRNDQRAHASEVSRKIDELAKGVTDTLMKVLTSHGPNG